MEFFMAFKNKLCRPDGSQVKINDPFWSEYLNNVKHVMMPYVFDKFEEIGYVENLLKRLIFEKLLCLKQRKGLRSLQNLSVAM